MPFVVPVLAAGFSAAAIGQALMGVALSVGMSALQRRLAPKPRELARSGAGMRLSLRVDPNAEREIVFGKAATAGSLVFWNTYGPNGNDILQLVYALADHECASLERVWVDGKLVTLGTDNGSGYQVSQYGGMYIKFHSGAWSQSADADLVAQAGERWSSSNRGRGVCYVRVTLSFNEQLYPSGLPRFLFEIKGAKLYDWRKDSTAGGSGAHRWSDPSTHEWTDNPVVCQYNWRRGIYVNGQRLAGMATAATAMPVAAWTAAANACDENVSLKAGGNEKRYRCGAVVAVNQDNKSVLTDLVTSYAGFEIDSGGQIVPKVGVAQSSVLDIVDGDLMSDSDVEITPRLPRSDLSNAAFGTFHDAAQMYEALSLPPRVSPDDEETDGGVHLPEHYALDYVTSGTQGQRVVEILRRRERWQRRIRLRLRSRFAVLEAGDWVSVDLLRYGIENATFEVLSAQLGNDLTVTVHLREVDASIYSWTPASDELDVANPGTVTSGGSTFTTIAGWNLVPIMVTGGSSSERPGLRATWTEITDPTVNAVEIEYRKQGDTVALTVRSEVPEAGQYTWVNGVQGGVTYEARARPIVSPERAVNWTGWDSTSSETGSQVVEVADIAIGVEPGAIGSEELDAQTAFELSLVTAVDEQLGSVSHDTQLAIDHIQEASAAAIQALIGQQQAKALVRVETTARETADSALAQQITTVATALDGNVAAVVVLQESIDGIEARWAVSININGEVTGLVKLDGTAEETTFDVVADKFRVSLPGTAGGGVVPVFQVSNVSGTPRLTLRGDMIADGSIAARAISVTSLSAIVANIGTITAGKLQRADGKMVIDLDNKQFKIEA